MGMFNHFDPNSGMGRGNRLGHMMYADTPPTRGIHGCRGSAGSGSEFKPGERAVAWA
jgi:hypothetical protein